MTVLLVGCGYWGQNWAKTLFKMNELGAICDSRTELYPQFETSYPGIALYSDLESALEHPGIEAVVVATPVTTHFEVASACLQAQKGVLVEKPLTLEPKQSQALVALAQNQGCQLAVGHILMYHPALLTLQKLIQQGELGEVLSVQCTRVNLGKIRHEENAWWSLAPHDLSILSLMLGEPFEPVSASQTTILKRPELPDTVSASFQTASGKQGSILVSWFSPYKKHETVVIGSEKIAIFEDTAPVGQKLQLIDYTLDESGIQKGAATYVDYETTDELLTLEAKGLLNAVRHCQPIPNTGDNGLHVVSMLAQVQAMLNAQTPCALSAK